MPTRLLSAELMTSKDTQNKAIISLYAFQPQGVDRHCTMYTD